MTTYCAQVELRQMGDEMRPTFVSAKKLEKRRCTHNPAISATECIKSIIGPNNKDRYCVATQDPELRLFLRSVPGTPLLYMNNSATVLEPISEATTLRAKQLEQKKMQPLDFEKITNKERRSTVHKKRKIKQPNPLSCKKSKNEKDEGPKRTRSRKRIKTESVGIEEPRITTTESNE